MNIDQKIIAALELGDGEDQLSQQIIENTKNIIETRLVLALDEMLVEDKRKEFDSIREAKGDAAARAWLDAAVVDTKELYNALLDDYLAQKRAER